ncbi:hypothetical protein EVAR_36963_1 [Eumeta japonica]|uniref:Uncharacterized protein n=1 Tax=Eumeta variegata TaxID=151549 RepID=A0A4C1W702_EUMVA|nr:hypothetical protein EVAR_36963_1 [Eumeta japonica]
MWSSVTRIYSAWDMFADSHMADFSALQPRVLTGQTLVLNQITGSATRTISSYHKKERNRASVALALSHLPRRRTLCERTVPKN